MKLKAWQVIILTCGSVVTGCLVCVAVILIADSLNLLATHTPTPLNVELPPPTATRIPTILLTATFTKMPVPITTSNPSFTPTSMPQLPVMAACIPQNERIRARVVKIIDGDTIEVVVNEKNIQVRYIGIDTPEFNDVGGLSAIEANRNLVADQIVVLIQDQSETDQYGRLLRYVLVGDLFINYELVRKGYAQARAYPPDTSCHTTFLWALTNAREAHIGLWSQASFSKQTAQAAPPPSSSSNISVCNCTGPDLDCPDFSTHASAQNCFNYCRSQGYGDIFRLDGDKDGLACEN